MRLRFTGQLICFSLYILKLLICEWVVEKRICFNDFVYNFPSRHPNRTHLIIKVAEIAFETFSFKVRAAIACRHVFNFISSLPHSHTRRHSSAPYSEHQIPNGFKCFVVIFTFIFVDAKHDMKFYSFHNPFMSFCFEGRRVFFSL